MAVAELASLASLRAFADTLIPVTARLDVLISNARVMAGRRRETVDGFEWTFAVNHLGPFLLTNLPRGLLAASAPARVINVGSELHRRAKSGLDVDDLETRRRESSSKADAVSKVANILVAVEIEHRWGGLGVTGRALHPGVVSTSFGKGPEGSRSMGIMMTVLSPFFRSPTDGARTTVLLATAADEVVDRGVCWSDSAPADPSPVAVAALAAERLWEASGRQVGLIA